MPQNAATTESAQGASPAEHARLLEQIETLKERAFAYEQQVDHYRDLAERYRRERDALLDKPPVTATA